MEGKVWGHLHQIRAVSNHWTGLLDWPLNPKLTTKATLNIFTTITHSPELKTAIVRLASEWHVPERAF